MPNLPLGGVPPLSKGLLKELKLVRSSCSFHLSVTVSLSGPIATCLGLGDDNRKQKTFKPVDKSKGTFSLEIDWWRSKSMLDELRAIASDRRKGTEGLRKLDGSVAAYCMHVPFAAY